MPPQMSSRIDQALSFKQTALDLRAHRQELIASNIANADTPHYKARDIDFKTSLAQMLGKTTPPVMLTRTSARHLPPVGPSAKSGELLYRTESQSAIDGNTVDLDVERAAFADNAVHMEALLSFINLDLRTALAAIQSQ